MAIHRQYLQNQMLAAVDRDDINQVSRLLNDRHATDELLHVAVLKAVEVGSLPVLDFLMSEYRTRSEPILPRALSIATRHDDAPVVFKLLSDGRSASVNLENTILNATQYGRVAVLEMLFEEYSELLSQERYAEVMQTAILSDQDEIVATLLISDSTTQYRTAIETCHEFSGVPVREIVTLITRNCDYNTCHYNLLLRELILERREFVYYLDWLIAECHRADTRSEVRLLISEAAKSVITPGYINHATPELTAYTAFLLLANTRSGGGALASNTGMSDIAMVMNWIEQESGVTNEGLRLSRLLLGAFEGRM